MTTMMIKNKFPPPVVAKFGGTSLADVPCMLKAAERVASNPEIGVVVLSASSGVTNQLLSLYSLALTGQWNKVELGFLELKKRYFDMFEVLSTEDDLLEKRLQQTLSSLKEILDQILGTSSLPQRNQRLHLHICQSDDVKKDKIVSYGEYLSCLLFANCLQLVFRQSSFSIDRKVVFIDATSYFVTDSHHGEAAPDLVRTKKNLSTSFHPILEDGGVVITQGFVGHCFATKEVTTLGRGGSDYTASCLASLLDAASLEIWTDVDGIFTTDPKIAPGQSRRIPVMSYAEAAQMAILGAKVLHPLTIGPVMEKGIPTYIGNSFSSINPTPQLPMGGVRPNERGTWILREADCAELKSLPLMRAITLKHKQIVLTVTTLKQLHCTGHLEGLARIFRKAGISIDHVTTSETSSSFVVTSEEHNAAVQSTQSAQFQQLKEALEKLGPVKVEEDLSLISLVGHELLEKGKKALFTVFIDLPIKYLFMGSCPYAVSLLVETERAETIVQKLHSSLLE